jgi:hypothetical protein
MPASPQKSVSSVSLRAVRGDTTTARIASRLTKDITVSWPDTAVTLKDAAEQSRAEVLFGEMLSCRPQDGWTRGDLLALCEWCRLTVASEKLTEEVLSGGGTQINQFGFQSLTPAVTILGKIDARRAAIWSNLKLGAASFIVETAASKLKLQKEAREAEDKRAKTQGLLA